MHDRPMSDMRPFLQQDRYAREHMNSTTLLDVTAVLDNDPPPIPADGRARTDIDILSDPYITSNRRLRMNKGRRVHHRPVSVEFVKHNFIFLNERLIRP